MSRLTPEADELVRAGRAALRPSDADRERVFQALLPQVGSSLGPTVNGATRASAGTRAVALKFSSLLVGLGLAGGALFLVLRPESPPEGTAIVPAETASASPTPIEALEPTAPSQVPRIEPPAKRVPVAPRPTDNLAQEVAILSRASAELHAGRPGSALKMLDEHRRKFPSGVLTQERTAARVQALCALGRMKEARAEFARLARMSPNSPHQARARKACGGSLTEN